MEYRKIERTVTGALAARWPTERERFGGHENTELGRGGHDRSLPKLFYQSEIS